MTFPGLCYVGKGMVGWCHNIDSHRLCVRNSLDFLLKCDAWCAKSSLLSS